MRQQNNQNGHSRHRNRGHRGGNNGGGNSNNNNNGMRRQQQVPLRNQSFDSHGPENTRVRGNAFQVYEKYMALAREAGERIDAENYYQHAEHYYRIIEAIQDHENEQRARYAEQQPQASYGDQPATGDQPHIPSEQPATDPFAPVDSSDAGMVDLSAPVEASPEAVAPDEAAAPARAPRRGRTTATAQ